ncbi:MAG: NusA N-terminal domain-containing protein, partial [Lachnospiraceae bacterium]
MNTELKEAIEALEKEKNIMRETLFEAIENALLTACKSNFGRVDNIKAWVDRDTFEYYCTAEKEVVETKDDVEDKLTQIALEDAVKINPAVRTGDKVEVKINSQSFGRIATQIAKNVILQKIREEERKVLYNEYYGIEKEVVTGIVQRINGKNISINLGKVDATLNENEQVKGETFRANERIK